MTRKSIAFSILTFAVLICLASESYAQLNSLRPIRRGGQFLGLGWGHGIHTRNPLSVSNYFHPYGPMNTPTQYSYGHASGDSFSYPAAQQHYTAPTQLWAPQMQEPTMWQDNSPETQLAPPATPETPETSWRQNQFQQHRAAVPNSGQANVWNNYQAEVHRRDARNRIQATATQWNRQSVPAQQAVGPNQIRSRTQPARSSQDNDFVLPELAPSRDW